jgi:V/A-type H+-transporting ATPase subunit K
MKGRNHWKMVIMVIFLMAAMFIPLSATAFGADGEGPSWLTFGPRTLCFMGAAIALILCGIGSAIGIGYAGQASLGVMSEDSKDFAKYLMLTALPGTQGIYGFVAAFLINQWSGQMETVTQSVGWDFFFASLPIGFVGMLSAIYQGKVCTAGVGMTAKKPEEVGKALVMGVFVEFYAVLGLLLTILLLLRIKA